MWYFRIIETGDGRWACRHGRRVLDADRELGEAIEHLKAVAREHLSAELILHQLDGTVWSLGPA